MADVFCFEPDVLIHAFDALAAKILAKTSREKSLKSPIFIALDYQLDDPDNRFVERVKREFAELNGVDISNVLVNFQIIG